MVARKEYMWFRHNITGLTFWSLAVESVYTELVDIEPLKSVG